MKSPSIETARRRIRALTLVTHVVVFGCGDDSSGQLSMSAGSDGPLTGNEAPDGTSSDGETGTGLDGDGGAETSAGTQTSETSHDSTASTSDDSSTGTEPPASTDDSGTDGTSGESESGDGSADCVPTGWTRTTLDASGATGLGLSSMAIDDQDTLYVLYADAPQHQLALVVSDDFGATWESLEPLVPPAGIIVGAPDLLVQGDGRIHVMYTTAPEQYGARTLYYASGARNEAWTTSSVVSSVGTGGSPSFAEDETSTVHVAYIGCLSTTWFLAHARLEAEGTWDGSSVDSVGGCGQDPSLAIDSEGGLHVLYQSGSDPRDLTYGYRAPGLPWTLEVVDRAEDQSGPIGSDTALVIENDGVVHAVYVQSGIEGSFRYARRDADGWTLETLGDGWSEEPAIGVDANDRIHLAYATGLDARIPMHLQRAANGWTATEIDPTTLVVSSMKMVTDSRGGIHVAYRESNGESRTIRYAYRCPS